MSATAEQADYVTIMWADFNGTNWDGVPFSASPVWLRQAVGDGRIREKPADRDYALWEVHTPSGIVTARPDDRIQFRRGEMTVLRRGGWAAVQPGDEA